MRYLIGLLLIVLGSGYILDQFGIIYFGDIISDWWPLLFVGVGVFNIFRSKGSIVSSTLLIAIGLMLLASTFSFIPSFWSLFWPICILLVGIWILTSRARHPRCNAAAIDELDGVAFFSGYNQKVTGENFRGGNLTAIFGGCEIDLSEVELSPTSTANLDITAAFGGVKLTVPKHWHIQSKGYPIFGGFENKVKGSTDPLEIKPVLNVNYFVLFGGVSITEKRERK